MTVDNNLSLAAHIKHALLNMLHKQLHDGETANGDLIHMDHQGAITHREKMHPRRFISNQNGMRPGLEVLLYEPLLQQCVTALISEHYSFKCRFKHVHIKPQSLLYFIFY